VRRQQRDELLAGVLARRLPLPVLRLLREESQLHGRCGVLQLRIQRVAQVHLPGAHGAALLMDAGLAFVVVTAPLAALLACAQTSTG
jgi:hypothetical protein